MADEAPAPRKVGTLRDRIAQFEQKPATAAPVPPPKPAAKKTWAWKDKQAEAAVGTPPPAVAAVAPAMAESSESTESTSAAPDPVSDQDTTSASAGMSAEDAKIAISQGGGLKARLAALQGSGFGALSDNAPVAPPVPGKPRVWKKATVPYEAPPRPEYASHETDEPTEEPSATTISEEPTGEDNDEHDPDAEEKDPEEEERQRRANIAARMARLGGARVGMPIAFGKKPIPTPPRKESGPQAERATSPSPPPVEKRESVDDRARQPVLPALPVRPISEDSEASTVEQPSETDDPDDEEEPVISASPPRARPPIPATRDWSRSPSPTTSLLQPKRSESQGSSFSLPRTVYRYPSYLPAIPPSVSTAGVKVAPHIVHDPSQFTLSPVAPSSPSAASSSAASVSSFSSSSSPAFLPSPRHRPMSHRHSDSALRSSMATVTPPEGHFHLGGPTARYKEPKAFFDPSHFAGSVDEHGRVPSPTAGYGQSQQPHAFGYEPAQPQYQAHHSQLPPLPHASLRLGKGVPMTGASVGLQGSNPNRLSRRASSSSFYPRPLERSTTLVAPHSHSSHHQRSASSASSFRKLFGFGWLKKRRLTEPTLNSSPSSSTVPVPHQHHHQQSHGATSLKRNESVSSSMITPAARIKSKYQIASGMTPITASGRDKPIPLLPVPSSESSSDRDVVSMNSPVDETASLFDPPAPPPKKIPPPRPSKPYSPPSSSTSLSKSASLTRSVSSASADSRSRRLQRPNNPNSNVVRSGTGTPHPFSTRKPSFSDNASVLSGPGTTSVSSFRSYNNGGSPPANMPYGTMPYYQHSSIPPSAWGSASSSQLGVAVPPSHPAYYGASS
ncbi:hypothetical protein FRB93_012733 [Tulasnella sp. JGI-2019a]|nr:hypothetical protein FRB93_012733 [Tulasnella sp. JGI-2019a]